MDPQKKLTTRFLRSGQVYSFRSLNEKYLKFPARLVGSTNFDFIFISINILLIVTNKYLI